METNTYYLLSFRTDISQVETLNIPRANEALDDVKVRELMERIIATGIVASSKGFSEAIDSAEIVQITREAIA